MGPVPPQAPPGRGPRPGGWIRASRVLVVAIVSMWQKLRDYLE